MTTVNVTVTLLDTTGDGISGARVEAKLFVPDVLSDGTVPESLTYEGTTDVNGQAVLAVWPNSLNTTVQTYYRFRAWHPTTKAKKLDTCAYISGACNLSDVSYACRGTTSGSTGAAESAALAAHIGQATGAHAASAISVLDTANNFTAGNVETVLAEIKDNPLRYFTESRTTTAPNATVPVHSLTASGTGTNIEAAIISKGSGAHVAQIADGTVTGGNKRGSYAVDWQKSRQTSAGVASGNYSTIGGGADNIASGQYSCVPGGNNGTASGEYSFVGGGISGRATGERSATLGGTSSTAGGKNSVAIGGSGATTRGLENRISFGALGTFTDTAQGGIHPLLVETTDATATIVTADGIPPDLATVSILPDDHAYLITARVIARDTSTGDAKGWRIEGLVTRGADASTTALVGSATKTVIAASAGASAWDIDIVVNTSRGSAEIEVTGESGKTIHWFCQFDTQEVG